MARVIKKGINLKERKKIYTVEIWDDGFVTVNIENKKGINIYYHLQIEGGFDLDTFPVEKITPFHAECKEELEFLLKRI